MSKTILQITYLPPIKHAWLQWIKVKERERREKKKFSLSKKEIKELLVYNKNKGDYN